MEENNQKETKPKTVVNIKIKPSILIIVAIVVVVILGVFAFGKKSSLSVNASIDKIIKINNLSTVEYPYEGIAKVKIEKEEYKLVDTQKEADVFINYKARVILGIDFDKVTYDVDKNNKMVIFNMPTVETLGPEGNEFNIDLELKTIKKHGWTKVSEEKSRQAANEDIRRRVFYNKDGNDLIQLTKDNIEDIITKLMTSVDKKYTIEFKWGA